MKFNPNTGNDAFDDLLMNCYKKGKNNGINIGMILGAISCAVGNIIGFLIR